MKAVSESLTETPLRQVINERKQEVQGEIVETGMSGRNNGQLYRATSPRQGSPCPARTAMRIVEHIILKLLIQTWQAFSGVRSLAILRRTLGSIEPARLKMAVKTTKDSTNAVIKYRCSIDGIGGIGLATLDACEPFNLKEAEADLTCRILHSVVFGGILERKISTLELSCREILPTCKVRRLSDKLPKRRGVK